VNEISFLFFLTGNRHKFQEVRTFIQSTGLKSKLQQLSIPLEEIQSDSLEEVAIHKVRNAADKVSGDYFVEDAGFFVDFLNGFPGVFSSYVQKMIGNAGILQLMEGINNRKAHFRSVIALKLEGKIHTFIGEVTGTVSQKIKGTKGFGFDPIFIPDNYKNTFAQISMEEKNTLSHRIKALRQMCEFLLQRENS